MYPTHFWTPHTPQTILYVRLIRQKTAKNLEFIKSDAVTQFLCSQFLFTVFIFSIPYSFLQSKSLCKMVSDYSF